MIDVRPSPISGTWYPGDPETLAQSIDHYLNDIVITPLLGELKGVIVPHAGHRYSGQVAAHAFRYLEGLTPEVVAVISPLHHPHLGQVLTTGHDAYGTPLGNVPVDHALLQRFEAELNENGGIEVSYVRNDGEHSLEIELPFLQRVLPQPFRLLPLMLRDQSRPTVEAVGHALGKVLIDQSAILVASSDLSHFYPQPMAQRLDAEVLSRIEAYDPSGVLSAEEEGLGFACGRAA
ncbi:MAG TPA: AmmeMemoRadiSam system protein B, partial [Anaerolineae bacterium]|nr:AmmeMemoRadiSam system protein B [Anaerolineae bacterium]